MESQRQSTANGKNVQVTCDPAYTSRATFKRYNQEDDATSAVLRYLAQTIVVIGVGLAIFLAIQILAVSSPTDAIRTASRAATNFKMSNLIKRFTDILLSLIVLSVLFPILILVSIIIFILEGHPIFYISRRYISLDHCVSILKFRTMVKDATSPKYRLRERFMRDGYLDIPLDCEVYTPIGRLLERSQIVEVLQFFNILFHGMSLIGNRPLPLENIQLLKQFPEWEVRFDSPAGISGLSQVVGKLNQSPQERLELECLYSRVYQSKNGNILLCDWFIIYYTLRLLLLGKGISIQKARQLAEAACRQ